MAEFKKSNLVVAPIDEVMNNDEFPKQDVNDKHLDYESFLSLVNGSIDNNTSKCYFLMSHECVDLDEVSASTNQDLINNNCEYFTSDSVIVNISEIQGPIKNTTFVKLDIKFLQTRINNMMKINKMLDKYFAEMQSIANGKNEAATCMISIIPKWHTERYIKNGIYEFDLSSPVFKVITADNFAKTTDTISLLFLGDTCDYVKNTELTMDEIKKIALQEKSNIQSKSDEEAELKYEKEQKDKEFLLEQEEFRKKNYNRVVDDNITVGRGSIENKNGENE